MKSHWNTLGSTGGSSSIWGIKGVIRNSDSKETSLVKNARKDYSRMKDGIYTEL